MGDMEWASTATERKVPQRKSVQGGSRARSRTRAEFRTHRGAELEGGRDWCGNSSRGHNCCRHLP